MRKRRIDTNMHKREIKATNWQTLLSKASKKTLVSALRNPDCPAVFKRSTLYIGVEKVVLHLTQTIRMHQVCNWFGDLDWEKAEGSHASIVSGLEKVGSVEIFRHFPTASSDPPPVRPSDDHRIIGQVAPATSEVVPETSEVAPETNEVSRPICARCEAQNNVSLQFLRVYASFFPNDEHECNINDSEACKHMAEDMIDYLEETNRKITGLQNHNQELKLEVSLSLSVLQQVDNLRCLNANLELEIVRLKLENQTIQDAFDNLSKQQITERNQLRRSKAQRKPLTGWGQTASRWTESARK